MHTLLAFVDLIPVILFIASSVILQRYLYDKMSKGAFALFASGTIMICVAGFFKAVWKILFNLSICDFQRLNNTFFPMQATGFLLAGISALAMKFFRQDKETLRAHALLPVLITAPAVFSGTMIFVIAMVFGTVSMNTVLALDAKKQHKPAPVVLFALAAVCLLIMGYLSSKDFTLDYMNWIAECINIAGQIMFLTASIRLSKA